MEFMRIIFLFAILSSFFTFANSFEESIQTIMENSKRQSIVSTFSMRGKDYEISKTEKRAWRELQNNFTPLTAAILVFAISWIVFTLLTYKRPSGSLGVHIPTFSAEDRMAIKARAEFEANIARNIDKQSPKNRKSEIQPQA